MKKSVCIILIVMLIITLFGGCVKIETRTDIEPLLNHLPDFAIKSAHWYGGVKEDRYAGVGPGAVVIYGVAKINADFAQDIKEKYEWIEGDTDHILDLLAHLDTKGYLDIEQNYLYSKDFTEDTANKTNTDVLVGSENNMTNFDVLVSFKNNTIIFYAEYMDF